MSNKEPIEKVLAELDKAILEEEMAIPIYSSHLATTISRSGLPDEQAEIISQNLLTLSQESLKHIGLLKAAKELLNRKETI